jgi:FKBP-type peptidyl-prolyl cis-trans isomerase FkpA
MRWQRFLGASAMAALTGMPLACSSSEPSEPVATARKEEPKVKIEDVTEGQGDPAKLGDRIIVHYTGWLTDGTKFDSSVDRGEPFRIRLGERRVIRGWEEGLLGMKAGGKRRLTIPPELAYGSQPQGQIPANATLIFEIELLQFD